MKTYYRDDDGNFHLIDGREVTSIITFDEGIWYVNKILKGLEYTFVADDIEKLPAKMDLISFLPYKYKIAKKIKSRLDEAEMNTEYGVNDKVKVGQIMKIIEEAIGGKR